MISPTHLNDVTASVSLPLSLSSARVGSHCDSYFSCSSYSSVLPCPHGVDGFVSVLYFLLSLPLSCNLNPIQSQAFLVLAIFLLHYVTWSYCLLFVSSVHVGPHYDSYFSYSSCSFVPHYAHTVDGAFSVLCALTNLLLSPLEYRSQSLSFSHGLDPFRPYLYLVPENLSWHGKRWISLHLSVSSAHVGPHSDSYFSCPPCSSVPL
mmetsp:Transcript_64/g.158  ORF Transcript_64/g.158 Transcript_64/m.158 type:complete len:206 (-) Transcript_64:1516-2133(-)